MTIKLDDTLATSQKIISSYAQLAIPLPDFFAAKIPEQNQKEFSHKRAEFLHEQIKGIQLAS